jgi:hypothetical protein
VPRSNRGLFAAVLVVGVATVSVLTAVVLADVRETAVEAAGTDAIRVTQAMFAALQRDDVQRMDAALEALSADGALVSSFLAGDRARLLATALPHFSKLRDRDGITHWYFIGVDRRTFLRVHRPDLHGDVIARGTLQQAAGKGGLASGLELGQTAFALRVVRPWYVGGKLIGFMELAEEIDHFLERMKADTGNDFSILVKKKFLDEETWRRSNGRVRDTWNERPEVVVVDTTNFTDGLVDYQGDLERVPPGGLVLGEESDGTRAWIRGLLPFYDATGRQVGAMVVAHDFSRMHAALRRSRLRVLVVVLALSGGASLVAWFAAGRLVPDRSSTGPRGRA